MCENWIREPITKKPRLSRDKAIEGYSSESKSRVGVERGESKEEGEGIDYDTVTV